MLPKTKLEPRILERSAQNLEILKFLNTELIYSRVMYLLSIGITTLEDVLKFELSSIPFSLFENNGQIRVSKSKSDLKKALQVEMSLRLQPKSNVAIIDVCAQLWAASWPTNGTVEDLGDALHHLVLSYLTANADVYLVSDRYYKYSIKGLTKA